jgi:hypothetical protein
MSCWRQSAPSHQDDILLETVRAVKLTTGRCLSPLIMLLLLPPPTPPCDDVLLAFIGDTKDNLAFIGETSLVASLDGENEHRRLFPGGDTSTTGLGLGSNLLWLLSLDPRALGGDLTRNLCGVCRARTGDRQLENRFCFFADDGEAYAVEEEVGAQNAGLGNITVFLAQGRFLGDTLFAATDDGRPRGEAGLN